MHDSDFIEGIKNGPLKRPFCVFTPDEARAGGIKLLKNFKQF
jgi:hypothetical protein